MQQPFTSRPVWRYGFLLLIFCLLAWGACLLPEKFASHKRAPFSPVIVPLMLLINHIAFNFVQSPKLKKIAEVIAILFIIFACAYIFTIR
jgi:hypothetical protein